MEEKRVKRDREGNENTIGDGLEQGIFFSFSFLPSVLSLFRLLLTHSSLVHTYIHTHMHLRTKISTYRYRVVGPKTLGRIFEVVRR